MESRNFSVRALALGLALLLAQPFALLAQSSTPQLPNPGSPGMTKEQQEKLGLQAMGEVYKQMPVLPDSAPETQYVRSLGRKLVAVIPPEQSWPYQFHVIPAADINAFALPGGPIFINLGAIQAAKNEAELAGVMAHEMSHVYMQHSAKQAPKASIAQIVAGLAGAVLPQSGLGNLGRMGIQIGAGTMLMKYSRADESQADSTGAIIMYRAGYNPKAMADFFQTLEQKYGKGGAQILSDHPNPGNRTAAIQSEIRNWPQKNYVTNSAEFPRVKEEATRTKAYSAQEIANGAKSGAWAEQNRKNGAIPAGLNTSSNEGNGSGAGGSNGSGAGVGANTTEVAYREVKPSGNFSRHEGQGFTLSYPDNWKVTGDQNTTIIAPPSGAGETGIAYGVVLGIKAGDTSSLDDATQQLAQGLAQDNPGMKVSGQLKNVDINGMQGRSLELLGNSPLQLNGQPLPERDLLVTLPRAQGGLVYLVFISPDRDYNQLHSTYQKMLESLQLR